MNKTTYFHQSILKSRYRYSITPNQQKRKSSLNVCETIENEIEILDECDLEIYKILHEYEITLLQNSQEEHNDDYPFKRSYFPPLYE